MDLRDHCRQSLREFVAIRQLCPLPIISTGRFHPALRDNQISEIAPSRRANLLTSSMLMYWKPAAAKPDETMLSAVASSTFALMPAQANLFLMV